jgi:hypothetical protein
VSIARCFERRLRSLSRDPARKMDHIELTGGIELAFAAASTELIFNFILCVENDRLLLFRRDPDQVSARITIRYAGSGKSTELTEESRSYVLCSGQEVSDSVKVFQNSRTGTPSRRLHGKPIRPLRLARLSLKLRSQSIRHIIWAAFHRLRCLCFERR